MPKQGMWEARRNTRKSTEVGQKQSCGAPTLCRELFHKSQNPFQRQPLTEAIITSILTDEGLTGSERVAALPTVIQILSGRAGTGTHDFPSEASVPYSVLCYLGKSCNLSEIPFLFCTIVTVLALRTPESLCKRKGKEMDG